MKLLLTSLLISVTLVSCKEDRRLPIYEGTTKIAVPDYFRDIGYDSVQFIQWDKNDWHNDSIEISFCYPNGLRFKKDTVYTGDTAYRLWGFKVRLALGIYIATKEGRNMTMSEGHFHENGCDSVTIDSFKIVITKIKPQ